MQTQLNHGDVYWVDIPFRANTCTECGTRPCVIVSSSDRFTNSPVVMVCPMTTKLDTYPFHPKVDVNRKVGEVLCDHIMTVDVSQLGGYICTLNEVEIGVVDNYMKMALGIYGVV